MSTPRPPLDINYRMILELQDEIAKLKKDSLENKKMATSAMKDCIKLRIEIQRLNTRMISNENDVRHISSKR